MQLIEKQHWARERVWHWWDTLEAKYGVQLDERPTIKFDEATICAGRGGRGLVSLSNHFLMNEEGFDQTIAHEVCHSFVNTYYKRNCKHGWEWKQAMIKLGLKPDRCHSYASSIYRHSTTVLNCPKCQGRIKLGKNVQNKIKAGQRRVCNRCRHPITPELVKAANYAKIGLTLPENGV